MCVVSYVSDYYWKQYPEWKFEGPLPNTTSLETEEIKQSLREVVKRLNDIDKRLKERDCMDDVKEKFFKWLEIDNGT